MTTPIQLNSENVGLLSSSLFRLLSSHSKADALLTSALQEAPDLPCAALGAFSTVIADVFRHNELQRYADTRVGLGDRRSLRGSYALSLAVTKAILSNEKPFFARDTCHRALVANSARVASFDDAVEVRTAAPHAAGQAHWSMLHQLLGALDQVAERLANEAVEARGDGPLKGLFVNGEPVFIQLDTCSCASCSKRGLNPNMPTRLLCLYFEPTGTVQELVQDRKRSTAATNVKKELVDSEEDGSDLEMPPETPLVHDDEHVAHELHTAERKTRRRSTRSDSLDAEHPKEDNAAQLGDFMHSVRGVIANQVQDEIAKAVAEATAALRATYERELSDSRVTIEALTAQIDHLQTQLQQRAKPAFFHMPSPHAWGELSTSDLLMPSPSPASPPRKMGRVGSMQNLQAAAPAPPSLHGIPSSPAELLIF